MRLLRLPVSIAIALLVLRPGLARGQAPAPDAVQPGPVRVGDVREGEIRPAADPSGAVRALAAGDTVRVVSAAGRYTGTIARITPDTLVVSASGRLDAIPRADVTRLERFVGRSSRGQAILKGAGAGLLAGGALGAIAGRLAGRIDCHAGEEGCVPGTHDGVIQGALIAEGVVIGSLVGAMLGPTFRRTHWENASAAFPLAAGPAPGGGVAAGLTLRF